MWRLSARNGARYVIHRGRRLITRRDHRNHLDDEFAIRTAQDVARELGNMKGAMMKFGQLLGFIIEGLPEDAQRALAMLQADAPPMAPETAELVVQQQLGKPPSKLFVDWQRTPIAAASIGQVHKAVTRDGRDVAVKVQYPGVGEAIDADLRNTEMLYRMVGAFALKGLDYKGLADELRARMIDELDYRIEAANQIEFADYFAHHPFIRVPTVDPATSSERVLTTEFIDGLNFAQFQQQATPGAKQIAAESIWRFAQHSVNVYGAFNGDPHPGNYRFDPSGRVTFLDFGLVKRWTNGDWQRLEPSLDAIIVHRDPEQLLHAMEAVGFLKSGHGLAAQPVYDYVSTAYTPYLTDSFTFTPTFMKDAIAAIVDINGPYAHVIAQLNMPPSFVILDRVVWGVSSILAKLEATGPWRAMLLEYRSGGSPATPMGIQDLNWRNQQSGRTW